MSTDPVAPDASVAPDAPVTTDAAIVADADANEAASTDLLDGRSRVTLPPRSPDAAEALAELEAVQPPAEDDAPPSYDSMAHLLPR